MALQTLLARFPKYSARKVRRLAEHLEWLGNHRDQDIIIRQVADDLQDYHLLKAQQESQLNDDVRVVGLHPALSEPFGLPQTTQDQQDAVARRNGEKLHTMALMKDVDGKLPDAPTAGRISVTPVAAARKAIDELQAMGLRRLPDDAIAYWTELVDRARGIVNGQSFYTNRTEIQARLSPQDELPLEPQ